MKYYESATSKLH